ncbi:MAG TPA: glycosyltransferase [Fimbriimonas sp.]
MRFVLSTTVQAHTFDVARELQRRSALAGLLTGMPRSRLARRGLCGPEVLSFPLPVLAGMAARRLVMSQAFELRSEAPPKAAFDRWAARNLPEGDIFIATSSCGLETGRRAKSRGMLWVCDRPCSHILAQDRLLREEYELQGARWPGISKTIIDRELAEYDEADRILVPSRFAERSFLDHGTDPAKIWRLPYGVDLTRFTPGDTGKSDRFRVLYAGQKTHQKGIAYLLTAFDLLRKPGKELLIVGSESPETSELLSRAACTNVRTVPSVPRETLARFMASSHALVLPSIQEGLALVQAEAMACGCPVIATTNTGGEDLFTDGLEGFIVPIRDPLAIAERLQQLADDPDLQRNMAGRARASVQSLGGWATYVDRLIELARCQTEAAA